MYTALLLPSLVSLSRPVTVLSVLQPQTRHASLSVTVTSSDTPCLVLFLIKAQASCVSAFGSRCWWWRQSWPWSAILQPQTRHASLSVTVASSDTPCLLLFLIKAQASCVSAFMSQYTLHIHCHAFGSVSNTVTTSSSSSVLYWRFFQSWFVLFTLYILDISYLKSPSCVPAQHYVSVTSCHCHLTVTSSDTP